MERTPAPSDRVLGLAEMFGIGLDETHEVAVVDRLRLDVRPGDVVLLTGPSGSGKTVLLEALVAAITERDEAARLRQDARLRQGSHLRQGSRPRQGSCLRQGYGGQAGGRARVVRLAEVEPPPEAAAIDGIPAPFEAALRHASAAGLADAFALLRRPAELSDGQRWRLRLAHALARLAGEPYGGPRVLVADEFCSTLDRLCARAVAYRVARTARAGGITALLATAHDDLVRDLAPDVTVLKEPGAAARVVYADPAREPATSDVPEAARGERGAA